MEAAFPANQARRLGCIKKAGPFGPAGCAFTSTYREGGGGVVELPVLPPFGETVVGHGVPGVGFIPLLPAFALWLLPEEVDGLELDPVVVLPAVPLAVPGKVPQGDEVGEAVEPLGAVLLFGAVLFGVAVFPGVVVLGVVDSGAVPLGLELGEAEPGVF